ncbi:hypothetical protein Hanom_Chr09g00771001 [Helianthus anomalus]
MYLKHSSLEKHRQRLVAKAKLFEQAKAQFAKEKEAFEQEKRSEEWGLQGLKKKLQASICSPLKHKDKYEEAKSHQEHVEVLQVELSQQISSKDKDLTGKDVEIAELQRRLREAQENLEAEKQKSDSLEINLAAEKVKAETAEEAHKVSQTALNVTQDNYSEVQATVEPLITDLGWLQHYGVTHIVNSILNADELDWAVVALTMST